MHCPDTCCALLIPVRPEKGAALGRGRRAHGGLCCAACCVSSGGCRGADVTEPARNSRTGVRLQRGFYKRMAAGPVWAAGQGLRGPWGSVCVPCVKPVQGGVAGTRPVRRQHPRSHSSAANISTPEGQGARNLDSHLEFFVLEVEFCYRLKRLPCRSDRAPGGQGAALGPTSEQHFF